jgi:hypothetical protein
MKEAIMLSLSGYRIYTPRLESIKKAAASASTRGGEARALSSMAAA